MIRLAVVGAGSWGTALALALAPRFDRVRLWARDPHRAAEIQAARENRRYLSGFALPDRIEISADLSHVIQQADIALTVVPAQHLRPAIVELRPWIPRETILVSAAKGIEERTLCRMSEVIAGTLGDAASGRIAVLSGPTFAKEIAAGEPAAVVIAAEDLALAEHIQRAFATPTLRFYASTDIVGVELGAALKNVIAIGAGICRGLGLGSNSVAALITRGLAEITRLAVAMGACSRTLSGLAGLGDLVLTATGNLSRNRYVGLQLGEGRKLEDVLAGMSMVAEGVATCRAAHQLGRDKNIDLPIINQMYRVLYESKDPLQATRELMDRPLTNE